MKRDPNTGKYLPKNKRSAALRTAASSIGRVFRGNPRKPVEADEDAVRELVLYAENDGDLYRQQRQSIETNLAKKYRAGSYDHEKAVKLWRYFTDNAAKKYVREFGSGNSPIFSTADRQAAAREFADGYLDTLRVEHAAARKNPSHRTPKRRTARRTARRPVAKRTTHKVVRRAAKRRTRR